MNEFEIIRSAIAISMVSVAAYFDVKTRYVDDRVWVFGLGSFGFVSLVFFFAGNDIQELIKPVNLIGMVSGMGIAFTGWVMKFKGAGYATGDFFGLLALSVILPSFNGIVIPILVIIISCILATVSTITANLKHNISSKNRFSEFDEPTYKKIMAFFMIHKKSENENFTFPAEITVDGKRKFLFRHNPDTQEFTFHTKGIYVCTTPPMMISILVSLCFVIFSALVLQS